MIKIIYWCQEKNTQEVCSFCIFLDGMVEMEESKKWDIERIAGETAVNGSEQRCSCLVILCKWTSLMMETQARSETIKATCK